MLPKAQVKALTDKALVGLRISLSVNYLIFLGLSLFYFPKFFCVFTRLSFV